MKTSTAFLAVLSLSAISSVYAQATFVYDQQSATGDTGESIFTIQTSQPMGQSFTPSLSAVGFVRLYVFDNSIDNIGATLYVNLRGDSITGPILGSTQPVVLPDRAAGTVDFIFTTPVDVTPGTSYYFQPIVQAGGTWRILADRNYKYPGGTYFSLGLSDPDYDLWFREGIIVPEPSGRVLLTLALSICFYLNRERLRRT